VRDLLSDQPNNVVLSASFNDTVLIAFLTL